MIPVSQPCIDESDISAAITALRSGWIGSIGDELRGFERDFAAYIGSKFCVACSNGTTALQLALSAAKIGCGDEVIIPNLTFAAVANAVLAVSAVPICIDVDSETWNMDVKKIDLAITARTKAIIAVHSYGVPLDVRDIKRRFPQLVVIEDCAEAHGAEINGNKVGSLGDFATFSFYSNKIIATGEGGCVLTNNTEMHEKLKLLRDHGMDKNKRFFHIEPGFNYRMTNIQGALGRTQLSKIDRFIEDRKNQMERYDRKLLRLGFKSPILINNSKSVNWLYTRLVPEGIDRDELMIYLKKNNIETRPIFKPINTFPYISKEHNSANKYFNSNYLSVRGISLPTYNGITNEQQDKIINCIEDFLLEKNYS